MDRAADCPTRKGKNGKGDKGKGKGKGKDRDNGKGYPGKGYPGNQKGYGNWYEQNAPQPSWRHQPWNDWNPSYRGGRQDGKASSWGKAGGKGSSWGKGYAMQCDDNSGNNWGSSAAPPSLCVVFGDESTCTQAAEKEVEDEKEWTLAKNTVKMPKHKNPTSENTDIASKTRATFEVLM